MTKRKYFETGEMSPELQKYHRMKAAGICVACCVRPNAGGKGRCAPCNEKRKKLSQAQKALRPEGNCHQCLTKPARKDRSTCVTCAEQNKVRSKSTNGKVRSDLIARYGGGCNCCGLAIAKYLQLHHINGDGGKERTSLPKHVRGTNFYKYVLKLPVRHDLEWLCGNCHEAKKHGGCSPEDHATTHKTFLTIHD